MSELSLEGTPLINTDTDTTVNIAGGGRVPPAVVSFFAGAAAGFVVDVGLYPIDTIKTRLQGKGGFKSNGGFKDIYKGLGVVTVGSVPGAALFFATYDSVCRKLLPRIEAWEESNNINNNNNNNNSASPSAYSLSVRVVAGSVAECAACLVRVPVEMFKQRLQTGAEPSRRAVWAGVVREAAEEAAVSKGFLAYSSSYSEVRRVSVVGGSKIAEDVAASATATRYAPMSAVARVLYRGYPITIFREVPFAMIQMPLYELLKARFSTTTTTNNNNNSSPIIVASSSLFDSFPFLRGIAPGFISGGVAAVLTTPLDVTKTRIMTMRRGKEEAEALRRAAGGGFSTTTTAGGVRLAKEAMRRVVREEGARALFKGGMTRAVWISAGGALFFGTYEGVKATLLAQ